MWLTSEALCQNIGVRDLICEAEKAGVCRNGMNTLQKRRKNKFGWSRGRNPTHKDFALHDDR